MNRYLVPLGFFLSLVVSFLIWANMQLFIGEFGEEIKKAGPLVALLIWLLILQVSFVIERLWSLKKAQGTGSLPDFLNGVRKKLHTGDRDPALRQAARLGGQRDACRPRPLHEPPSRERSQG